MSEDDLVKEIDSIIINGGNITINIIKLESPMKNIEETPQEKHKHTYMLISSISGIVFLAAFIVISMFFPNPTPFQYRIWIGVMSLSAAAFGGTITGILSVKASLGKQMAVSATGALGILVIFYFANPAGM